MFIQKRERNENLQGRYDNVEEAQDTVKKLTEDEGNGSIFDYFYKEEDYEEITDRVKTYEDACKVLGVEPINEQNAKAQGFRSDEIARRKLETIAAALNEGWKPDWNNTDQYKYYPLLLYTRKRERQKVLPGFRARIRLPRLRIRLRVSALGFASTLHVWHGTRATNLQTYTNKFLIEKL